MLSKTKEFAEIKRQVADIMETENSFYLWEDGYNYHQDFLEEPDNYSDYGLMSCGSRIGFPHTFVRKHNKSHKETAKTIMKECYTDYLRSLSGRKSKALLIRSFLGKISGVLTDRYSIFDDNEVVDLLENNDYLMDAEEFWHDISPEHFHARFVSKKTLNFEGDTSPLHFCVFVDNSMVGESSLRIRFGLYRSACTNGMIFGFKQFEIVKECHKGKKDYQYILNTALSKCEEYEETLLKAVEKMNMEQSSIYALEDEKALSYLKDKLGVSKKGSAKILEFYRNTYNGTSKWDLCNAITDYAHEIENISDRIKLEQLAVKVA